MRLGAVLVSPLVADLARLSDRLPLPLRWRMIFPFAFGLLAFALPAWLAMAAFQRSAGEGLLRLPVSLFWRPAAQVEPAGDFIYPSIGVRQGERLIKTLLQESGCSASLLLYDLGAVLSPGQNLPAMSIGGPPHFTLDLFALTGER